MQPRRAALDVLSFAAAVRAGAVEAGRRETLSRAHRRHLSLERRRVETIDDDGPRLALVELLEAVERVLVCAEMGEPIDGAVRELDVRLRVVERLHAARRDVA